MAFFPQAGVAVSELQLFLSVLGSVVATTLAIGGMLKWALGNLRDLVVEKIEGLKKDVGRIDKAFADHEGRLRELEKGRS